jgi:hypothetical protein
MNKSKSMRWAGHVAPIGRENGNRIWVGKPEGKTPHDIRMRWNGGGIDWIELAIGYAPVEKGSCEHGNEPSGSIKCWTILGLGTELPARQEMFISMTLGVMGFPQ